VTAQQRTARILASLVLGLPSAAAIYGSAASLMHIAGEEALTAAWVLPFCLDLLAIGVVVSAVFCGHDDRLSRFTPVAAYAGSAALQVADVWDMGPRAWAVHALPLAAAILGTEKILRLWRPSAVGASVEVGSSGHRVAVEHPDLATTILAPVTLERPARKRAPRPTHRRSARRPEADPDAVKKVERAVAGIGRPLAEIDRDDVMEWMRANEIPGRHVSKVGPALRHLKEQS
jgi:hypothetical protein